MKRALVASAILMVAGAGLARGQVRQRTLAEDLQLFSQVLNQIRVNHPDSVEAHTLLIAAINGMVNAADPHSFVIPAVRFDGARYDAWLNGKLQPVAVDFSWMDGAAIVSSVTPGSKASRLDIMPGDELIEIDGKPLVADSPTELEITLAGNAGSSVPVVFERRRADGTIVQLPRTLPRERVGEQSAIPASLMLDATTGYIKINTFMGGKVSDDLHSAVESLGKRGMQRLVLDLRDNGGGRIDMAAGVAGEFLPKNALVFTTWGPKKETIDTVRVQRSFWESQKRYPLVVLVNAGTASASEIVAGALQDHDRATIVGQTSFGKALIMSGLPLSDGSMIELVVGHVSTPCGRVVQRTYKGFSHRYYLRTAGVAADTIGRPTCKTDAGRTVYGGGGIVPDVILPKRTTPEWASMLGESDAYVIWANGWAAAHAAQLTSADDFAKTALPADALADFRKFAEGKGVAIPADADARLNGILMRAVAFTKWGEDGAYRVRVVSDPEIKAALSAFKPQ